MNSGRKSAIGEGHACSEGFTLAELLITISLVAILSALLVPSIAGARRSAVELSCMARARSTSQALVIYGQDWGEWLPFAGWHERKAQAPDGHLEYRVGGLVGVAQGRWALLFQDGWDGRHWDRGLRCPRQPDYDPHVTGGTETSIADGFIQLPMFSLSRAFWLDPKLLTPERRWDEQRVRPARWSDVRYPSAKALLFEEIAFCVFGPEAQWAINRWGQTPYHPTSVAASDGAVVRLPRADGLPATYTWPLDATVDGVYGRDIPSGPGAPGR
jgi:prepilin-type N-terminal cleavage/methylation domain-containing protein